MSECGAITIQNFSINLNFETQTSKNGRPFRLSGISILWDKPKQYIDELKAFRHPTHYHFRYLDVENEFFTFEFNAKNQFVKKLKNKKQL